MHRNTTFLIVGLAIFAAIVTGVNLAKVEQNTPIENKLQSPPEVTPTPQPITYLTHTDPGCQISFTLPDTLDFTLNKNGGGIVQNQNRETTIGCTKIKTKLTNPDVFETLFIGSISAFLVSPEATSSNATHSLLFTHPFTKQEVRLTGQESEVIKIAETMQFTKPAEK
jgi:hypothetical protein